MTTYTTSRGPEKIARYCLCGGAVTGTASPPSLALALIAAFNQVHQREGCRPATRRQAAAARRREDRQRSRKDW